MDNHQSSTVFATFMQRLRAARLVAVQPRMGWGNPFKMRDALRAVKLISPRCIGTLTLDSYTRVGDYATPTRLLRERQPLNGYPLLSHSQATTRSVLEGICDASFAIQVRHGTPLPKAVMRRIIDVGLDATEGGPVSYCLPYGRTRLEVCTREWLDACRMLATECALGHIESFGGCLMGQLCPPSLLITMSLLECLFFVECGVRSVSLSYAQGTSLQQDRVALLLLHDLAARHLGTVDWHVVLYTYMGLFPCSEAGALQLIADSAQLAQQSGCARLIVKTKAERHQIPLLADNLEALTVAAAHTSAPSGAATLGGSERACYEQMAEEVDCLLSAVLNLAGSVAAALPLAFQRGLLDVPFCLHPDNPRLARAAIDEAGQLCWTAAGRLPLREVRSDLDERLTSDTLLQLLSYVSNRYDRVAARAAAQPQHAQVEVT